jgi:hypothetical protein
MKQHHSSSKSIGTVNDCAENKCINCIHNNGCIYMRSAFEMPQEIPTQEKIISANAISLVQPIVHPGNSFQYGL